MSLVVLAEIVSSAFIWVPADTTMDGGVRVMATSLVPPCPNMPVEPWVESTNVPRLSNVARQPGGESRARSYVCGPLPSLVSCSDAPVGSKASMASTPPGTLNSTSGNEETVNLRINSLVTSFSVSSPVTIIL